MGYPSTDRISWTALKVTAALFVLALIPLCGCIAEPVFESELGVYTATLSEPATGEVWTKHIRVETDRVMGFPYPCDFAGNHFHCEYGVAIIGVAYDQTKWVGYVLDGDFTSSTTFAATYVTTALCRRSECVFSEEHGLLLIEAVKTEE